MGQGDTPGRGLRHPAFGGRLPESDSWSVGKEDGTATGKGDTPSRGLRHPAFGGRLPESEAWSVGKEDGTATGKGGGGGGGDTLQASVYVVVPLEEGCRKARHGLWEKKGGTTTWKSGVWGVDAFQASHSGTSGRM